LLYFVQFLFCLGAPDLVSGGFLDCGESYRVNISGLRVDSHPAMSLLAHAKAAGRGGWRVYRGTHARPRQQASVLEGIIETDGELDHAVWGQGPAPLFTATFDVVAQRVVGEKHLKLKLARTGTSFEAMPDRIHAVYALMPNEFNGQQSLQLKLQLQLQHWEPAIGETDRKMTG
jgi:hypothetical protein